MVAFLKRMPAGIPGEVSRLTDSVIVPEVITPSGTTGAPTAYGIPVVVDATAGNIGNMRSFATSDIASAVYGFLVRPFPTNSSQDALGVSTPPTNGACDILRKGYMTVLLTGPNACVKGGQVYIWAGAASGTHIVGGIESVAGASGLALAGCIFRGPADSSGNVEIDVDCRVAFV